MNSPNSSEPDSIGITEPVTQPETSKRLGIFATEDWWAIWLGGILLLGALFVSWTKLPADYRQVVVQLENNIQALDQHKTSETLSEEELKVLKSETESAQKSLSPSPLPIPIGKLQTWVDAPMKSFYDKSGALILPGIGLGFLILAGVMGFGIWGMGESLPRFLIGFVGVFLLAVVAFLLSNQAFIKHWNLESALWAIMLGLIISNTLGTPGFLTPAIRTEFYIKTGLVLLGAEILFSKLLALGLPGIFISWITTPVVLIATYIFGQKILKMKSRSLNMVISADMSVCGVSAAIATGAACRAKKEELSLAIALSMGFTVVMMIVMPKFIEAVGMDHVVAGAWLGGTIDSTGAVAAAGKMLQSEGDNVALTVATTIKMIQNILIGAVAFCVSIYWVGWVEKSDNAQRVGISEIWKRFPKFMIGFMAASLAFSTLSVSSLLGENLTNAIQAGMTKDLREWLFCLAFVSIGLETNFRELMPYFRGGKPLVLYVVGQTLNLIMSLFMAWLMLTKVFPNAADILRK